jgi:hypothetical protein
MHYIFAASFCLLQQIWTECMEGQYRIIHNGSHRINEKNTCVE